MATVNLSLSTPPDDWIGDALRSETDFDDREIAPWLNDLLHRLHREVRDIDLA